MREKVDGGEKMKDELNNLEKEYNNSTTAQDDPRGRALVSKVLEVDSLEDGRTLLMHAAYKGKAQQFTDISQSIRERVSPTVPVTVQAIWWGTRVCDDESQ